MATSTKNEPGNWPAYNTKSIVNNVSSVFKNNDIGKLSKGTYNFIIQHMGFIAHYDLYGFMRSYSDVRQFARTLITSEYSNSNDYNLREADRRERDADFDRWYGPAYNKSVAETIRGIVGVATDYLSGTMVTATKYKTAKRSAQPKRAAGYTSVGKSR